MTKERITPVILSGGSGTRLWPVSTREHPKQFLNLTGPQTMFQQTLQRCTANKIFADPIIVANAAHRDLVVEQMAEIGIEPAAVILEPCARNTAPAIALAALACKNLQSPMLVMPSDHVISEKDIFLQAVQQSLPMATARWLVTFGITPTGPETGYGYIAKGDEIFGSENSFATSRFIEKPNQTNAEKMLAEGGYFWNAGIFLFRADAYLEAMENLAPEMLSAATKAMDAAVKDKRIIRPDETCFAEAPSDSIDYAIMEKHSKVAVTPTAPGWSDVGSWDALYDVRAKDDDANVIEGKGFAIDARNNLIIGDNLEIAAYGISDMIIVAKGETVLIMPRGGSQNVRKVVEHKFSKD